MTVRHNDCLIIRNRNRRRKNSKRDSNSNCSISSNINSNSISISISIRISSTISSSNSSINISNLTRTFQTASRIHCHYLQISIDKNYITRTQFQIGPQDGSFKSTFLTFSTLSTMSLSTFSLSILSFSTLSLSTLMEKKMLGPQYRSIQAQQICDLFRTDSFSHFHSDCLKTHIKHGDPLLSANWVIFVKTFVFPGLFGQWSQLWHSVTKKLHKKYSNMYISVKLL